MVTGWLIVSSSSSAWLTPGAARRRDRRGRRERASPTPACPPGAGLALTCPSALAVQVGQEGDGGVGGRVGVVAAPDEQHRDGGGVPEGAEHDALAPGLGDGGFGGGADPAAGGDHGP